MYRISEASLFSPENFSAALYEKMRQLTPAIDELELSEFRYALDNLYPEGG